RETADELGLSRLRERIARLMPPTPHEPTGESPTAQRAVLRREGQHWTVGLGKKTIRLKDGRGLGYLATLVREPGREFHVLDLAAGLDAPAGSARQAYLGVAVDLLAVSARAAYHLRVAA